MTDLVVVVGSVNADIIAAVPDRPSAGKTVLATDIVRRSGGKGANQAAASARGGAATVLVAAVGDDAEAPAQLAELSRDGVDLSRINVIAGTSTGLAFITLTPDGENSIVVAPGANHALTGEQAIAALSETQPAIVVLQTELSSTVIDDVATWCRQHQVRLILNDGPVVPLAAATLATADPLVLNEHEAQEVCAAHGTPAAGDLAFDVLRATAARSVVVTQGGHGSQVVEGDESYFVPAEAVAEVADTTGAGDTYVGTLAAALATGSELPEAVRRASVAAAESVTWVGARPPRS